MKNLFNITLAILASSILLSCSDWTEMESREIKQNGGINTQETDYAKSYFKNLRAYKKSDHAIAFGWFGNWNASGASQQGYLRSLPDSVDIISLWGNLFNPSAEKIADKEYVQKVKGTKIAICWIVQDLGSQLTPASVYERAKKEKISNEKAVREFWGWKDGKMGSKEHISAIKKYANAILDTINKYNYDGFDIDYEPQSGHAGTGDITKPEYLHVFIQELGKQLGPKSGTDKVLLLDGDPWVIKKESGAYIDYFITQTYTASSNRTLDYAYNQLKYIDDFSTKKFIVAENFESYWEKGGVNFTLPSGKTVPSLIGMAMWNPTDGRKGGVGTYHMEYEYPLNPDYKFLRKAIHIMNPPIK